MGNSRRAYRGRVPHAHISSRRTVSSASNQSRASGAVGLESISRRSFYNMYYGVGTRAYTNKTVLTAQTNFVVTLPARGVQFYFAVTATDSHGLESGFSNEASYMAPAPPAAPIMQPLVVLVVKSSPTATGTYADAGMNWSLSSDQAQQYFKLKINRGMIASATVPPMPKKQ